MKVKKIIINKISKTRFNAFVMFSREPRMVFFTQEIEYYGNEDNSILGTIVIDPVDRNYNCIVLGRDEEGKFSAIDIMIDYDSLNEARAKLIERMRYCSNELRSTVNSEAIKSGVDLFKVLITADKINPYFKRLFEDKHYVAAKRIITEMARYFEDIDGNFVEQFQSINGFDARLWEIYLFCLFTEETFTIIRKEERPDFIIKKMDAEIAVEAVIVARKKENPPTYITALKELQSEEIKKQIDNDMPLRFGSPLFSKLKNKYWELPHVKNKPIILAIADFHDNMSMVWSYNALVDYLYGLRFTAIHDAKGQLIISSEKIQPYTKETGGSVEAGYFYQPEVEHISAVLFSSTATISKFTRIGIQAGFGVKGQSVYRSGAAFNHDPDSVVPHIFLYEVNESGVETWAEGVNLFHNPNAIYKIDKGLFPSVAHHELKSDGQIHSLTPDFHPYFSMNHNVVFD
jgi:hypothetical protein